MSDSTQAAAGVDGVVERIGRWTANRHTRRSFIGKLGRLGVLVAGGTAMAGLLAEQAEARVCGQSGVAPKCATFSCDATWGWCWYASGCCADGALKKICDCCAPNTPHPVGYCPSGTRVLCILESCGADPRLTTKPVDLLGTADVTRLTVELSRRRYPHGAPIAVVGDANVTEFAAVAASLGGVVDGPVLLTPRSGLHGEVGEELARLGVEFVKVVGSGLSPGVDAELVARGVHVERIGSSPDPGTFSAEVARWSRPLTGTRSAIVVAAGVHALGPAAAVANGRRIPLLIGFGEAVQRALTEPRRVRSTYVVSHDAADAERVPGGRAIAASTAAALSRDLASLLVGLRGGTVAPTTLASADHELSAAAMATVPGTLLLHTPGSLDSATFEWLLARRLQIDRAFVGGERSWFPAAAEYDLQAVLNEYETHLLIGRGGDGLPVIPQPREERPIGKARR
jgi:hypothetical protein